MKTDELIANLLNRFPTKDKESEDTKSIALFALNIALSSVWRATSWNFRKQIGQVCLIPNYTTGTCSYTKFNGSNSSASRTVTFSGSTLTPSMVGRFWKPDNGNTWYKIISVSGSTVILGVEVADESASGQSFQIWKRIYYLKSEVDSVIDGFNWDSSSPINYKSNEILTQEQGNISNGGNPSSMSDLGIDPYDDVVYSTGNISGNEAENTITGIGTSWLGNVDSGDILKVNNNEYYIKRVESDTSIVLHNYLISKLTSQNYEIRKVNPVGVQYWNPSDKYRVVDYTYLSKPHEMKNKKYDLLPLDFDFVKAILDRAEAVILKDIDKDNKWVQTLNLYTAELEALKEKKQVIRSRSNQFSPVTFRNLM